MVCDKCKHRVVMHAFSYGNCKLCNENITTVHTPCDILCKDCSIKHNKCKMCGDDIPL